MALTYDELTEAFLEKVSEFDLMAMTIEGRQRSVDGYMRRAIVGFMHVCPYDLTGTADDVNRTFTASIPDKAKMEIIDIISDGMIVQWLKPYLNRQELLENVLNTRDFSQYSPANLLQKVTEAYHYAHKNYVNAVREYSYDIADLRRFNS